MSSVTLKGTPLALAGVLPKIGQVAPEFTLVAADLSLKTAADFTGKRKVLNLFPSVDTPTCAASVRHFNQQASQLVNTLVINISADLPFAQTRFCGAEGLENVINLSTFRHPDFLAQYGVAFAEGPLMGLCARAVIILDENNVVIYSELVSEVAQEPNYAAALAALA